MAHTVEVTPVRRTSSDHGAVVRKTRVVVKKFNPWSVFRFSLLYYFCIMLVALIGLTILYNILAALGVVDKVAKLMVELSLADQGFKIHGGWLFTRAFAIGLLMVVFWALVKLMTTFMYNLIAELVGGVEVTLTERRGPA
jgi:Transmembrane domain of unknown function (DUF3566)